jgi:hypothetical protein
MSPLGLLPPPSGLSSGSPGVAILGTGTSISPGVDSIIEFNNLMMNIRNNADAYIVNEVNGLEDADLRDDREVNPQAHGETYFDAFYGGRTITISGYIRAYTLNKLRDMQQALKQALADLSSEMPLIFHGYGDPTADVQIFCRKGAPLQMTEVQTDHNYFRRPFMITLRASNPRFLGMVDQYESADFSIIETFSPSWEDNYDLPAGSTGFIAVANELTFTATGTRRFIRKVDTGVVVDNDTEAVLQYHTDDTANADIHVIHKYLDDSNYLMAGVNAAGSLRISKRDAAVDTTLASTADLPRATGNYWVRSRIDSNTVIVEHFDQDPRINLLATPISTLSHTLSGANAIKFGVGVLGRVGWQAAPGTTNATMSDVSLGTYNASAASSLDVINLGNFSAQPVIGFTNAMNSPSIINTENGQQASLETVLVAGERRVLDIAQWTLKDGDGANKFNELGITSDWLELSPGENQIKFTATQMSPVFANDQWNLPGISVRHKHSWI